MTSGQQDDRDRGRTGVAPIKAEYLVPTPQGPSKSDRPGPADDDAAEGRGDGDGGEGKKNNKKKGGWKTRTQGKGAGSERTGERAFRLCRQYEQTGKCDLNKCKFSHSWDEYFALKPLDIHREAASALSDTPPHVAVTAAQVASDDVVGKSIDLSTVCPVYKELGYCPAGWRCRFLGGHVRKATEPADGSSPTRIGQWELLGRREHTEDREGLDDEVNWPKGPILHSLRKDTYEWDFTPKYLGKVEPNKPFSLKRPDLGTRKDAWKKKKVEVNEEEAMNAPSAEEGATNVVDEEDAMNGIVDGESEAIDVPLRPEEKRRLNWDNGLYLAPLTTVGNLPFRRVCVDYGATITISEMALAQPLVTGQNEEWALVRRHKSEKMFGVQLAGGWPNRMVPTAEMLARELGPSGIDFVDVNMGCPIDLVFNQGAGSALMDNSGRLEKILVGMNRALGEIPLTVKFRTGVASGKPNAHKLIPRFATEWGASAMTIHGRSRQQRYSKLADWKYIKQCVDTLREATEEANMAPVPIFGNGDCYSAQSYYEEKEASGVDGVMLARGALIKPWLFTEIAERREWDISATERLEGIRKFAEYGLSHWGSDTLGVNTTRRFLCEALSFQCRYVPIGLLERMPPMLNERPPPYRGRNELETLLSSPYVGDWVKISEMFLGPAGDDFRFVPKHKSNAYGNEEANG